MQKIIRHYSVSDVDMLIAAGTITENAIAHKEVLQAKRSAWNDPFFSNLKEDIEKATAACLGTDNIQRQRNATLNVRQLQQFAKTDLSELRVQIEEDFKADKIRRDELLTSLGFNTYGRELRRNSQEALMKLLFQVKSKLDHSLMAELESRGTDQALLERIMERADMLREAEIAQENSKAERPILTVTAVHKLNEIYDQTMSICRIASCFMKELPQAKALFSFDKTIKNMGVRHHVSHGGVNNTAPAA